MVFVVSLPDHEQSLIESHHADIPITRVCGLSTSSASSPSINFRFDGREAQGNFQGATQNWPASWFPCNRPAEREIIPCQTAHACAGGTARFLKVCTYSTIIFFYIIIALHTTKNLKLI